jgi:multiple sugar transport system permease protein
VRNYPEPDERNVLIMIKQKQYLYFTLPSFILMAAVLLYPLGYAVFNSFYSSNMGAVTRFVGMGNYFRVLADPGFYHSLGLSVLFTVSVVCLEFILGLLIAILLDQINFGKKLISVTLYIPFIITAAAAGVIFRWMIMPQWGIINQILAGINIAAPNWFDSPFWAMLAVIAAEIWQNTPFVIIILYSGLQSIPKEQVEAAGIDGASGGQVFWNVVIPNLRHLILLVLMMRTMDAWRLFDRIYAMTQGGPGDATETMVLYNFRMSFKLLRVGEGLAVGVLTLLFLCLPIYLYLKGMRSQEVD